MNPNLLKLLKLYFMTIGRIMPSTAMQVAERLFTSVPFSKRRDDEETLIARAEKFTVKMDNGHELAVYRWGHKADLMIMFVHGWTATGTCFSHFITHFLDEGYQVISYDAIGHGKSSGLRTSVPDWADSIHAVSEAVGPVRCMIGHSIGAMALIMASNIGLKTQKLVLLSPATSIKRFSKQFADTLSFPPNMREMFPRYLWKKYGHIAAKYGTDWEDVLISDFHVPTLIVHDENDKEVDIESSRWLARQWPWARLVGTKRLGHRRILLSKKTVSLVSEFARKSDVKVRG
ncbi:MAG: alpha/beta hydrolase [bacterium]|nr:alpha/beta hydrolase [bacterium]